jgi:hypothetical protein
MSQWPVRLAVYGAGDAINGANSLNTQIEWQLANLAKIATNPYVAAIAQLDSSITPSVRYVLDPSGRQPFTQLPDIDTGDPNALVDFISWSIAVCPSQRNVVVLSGHGCAWQDEEARQVLAGRGIVSPADDPKRSASIRHPRRLFGRPPATTSQLQTWAVLVDGSNRDYLSNVELAAACDRIAAATGSPIDTLVFDACLMSSWEILRELRQSVITVVASIDELSADGLDFSGPAADITAQQGVIEPQEIAESFVRRFKPKTSFDTCIAVHVAAQEWDRAAASFRDFSVALVDWVRSGPANADAARNALRLAATSVVRFSTGGLADVSMLLASFESVPGLPAACIDALRGAVSSIKSCVIAKSAGSDYQAAIGLSVFAPNSSHVYATNRPDYIRLSFSSDTGWTNVLDELYPDAVAKARTVTRALNGLEDTEFVVSLCGLGIDDTVKARIEQAIRRVALQELARLDHRGDLNIEPFQRFVATRGLGNGFGRTAGVVFRHKVEKIV